ncbi:MAG: oxygen-independent coproporphyrinogen III oxidase [Nitrospirae bacterium]|nr:MAG: oxygen-independent coproporphyrinogen III oxidase [Nitrospirota bacterium]
MSRLHVPHEMLARYDQAGPRYTSYPTAPQWTEAFGAAEFRAEIERTNALPDPPPLALYVHIPFCESMCYYCGCNIIISGDTAHADPYAAHLFREAEWYAELMAPGRPVVQWHIGGGSPTFMRPDQLDRLLKGFRERFPFSPEAELSIEVDPRITSTDHLDVLKENGFNRISMGIQDFDPEVQRTVNRIQPFEMTRDFIEACRARGFHHLNVDLIYGLPKQTPESFVPTVEKIIELDPTRIALFNYAHVPWMRPFQRRFDEADLPKGEQKVTILTNTIEQFTAAGYRYIGMDHFAKPDDELSLAQEDGTLHRNFMGYTTKANTHLYGIGVSSISEVGDCYAQNTRKLSAYTRKVEAGEWPTMRGILLTEDDKLRKRVISDLLVNLVVDKAKVEQDFGIDFDRYFADALEKLKQPEADGLIELGDTHLRVTELGRVFIRNLAMPFDAYLGRQADGAKPMYSRTV